jgi:hypothetical protein
VCTACTAIFSAADTRSLALLSQQLQAAVAAAANGNAHHSTNAFDSKTEASSAHMYFHYYGMLQHQQNMLQDSTRTGTYFWAIMGNRNDFEGATVVDVGAGSGILSLFAAQVRPCVSCDAGKGKSAFTSCRGHDLVMLVFLRQDRTAAQFGRALL